MCIRDRGKGQVDGEERQTATMRFYIENIEAKSWRKLEILLPEAFVLNNQYWVSFYEQGSIFDKKFVFAANTINDENMMPLPLLDKQGVIVFW